MDNASKALIMAGAILISLALVGLGVYIFTVSSDLQSDTQQQMDVMKAQTTNKQISNYEDTKVRGSQVKALFDLVDSLNAQQVFPAPIVYGAVGGTHTWSNGSSTTALDSGDSIRESAYYEIVMADLLLGDGYLDTIEIRAYSN